MKKIPKSLIVIFMALGMIGSSAISGLTSEAKTRAAHQLTVKKLKKTTYQAKKGYIYNSTKLTKITHNAKNYTHTNFYATKSATVRKANGNKAVYYYVSNKSGKIRGWIWRGYLKNMKVYKQKLADIKFVKSNIEDISDQASYSSIKGDIKYINTTNVYSWEYAGIPSILQQYPASDSFHDLDVAQAMYTYFKNRFSSATNKKLAKMDKIYLADYEKELADPGHSYDADYNMSILMHTLADAIAKWQ